MAVSDQFLDYVLDQLSHWGAVSVRRMFGGAGLYRDGKLFCVIADDVAYLKVDDASRDDFVRAGSAPFNPYPKLNKATVFSYYEIPPEVLENRDDFRRWAQRSLDIQEKRKARFGAGDAKTFNKTTGAPVATPVANADARDRPRRSVRSRQRMKPTIFIRKTVCFIALAAAALATTTGCDRRNAGGLGKVSPGIIIEEFGPIPLQHQTTKAVASAPLRAMKGGGLVGTLGGARVKMLKAGTHEVLLPMPQLANTTLL